MNLIEFLFAQLYVKYIESHTFNVAFYDRVYNDIKHNYDKYISSDYFPTNGNEEDWIMVRDSIADYLKFEVRIINY